jgi:DNA-binding NarL/FixJ family response regulator
MSATDSIACSTVLLADDHVKMLDIIKELFGPGYRVVAAVANGLLAVEAAKRLMPDLVILDIEMPVMDGIRAAKEMRRIGVKAKILFLTAYEDEDYLASTREIGNGYVLKSRMSSDLPHAIEAAFSGKFFVSRQNLGIG